MIGYTCTVTFTGADKTDFENLMDFICEASMMEDVTSQFSEVKQCVIEDD